MRRFHPDPGNSDPQKSSLSRPRARLIEKMQRLHFGTIEGLVIRDGEPVLDPPPHFVKAVKFCAKNGPRPESGLIDFALRAEVREFFAYLDKLGNGTIRRVEVQNGLPIRMEVEMEGENA